MEVYLGLRKLRVFTGSDHIPIWRVLANALFYMTEKGLEAISGTDCVCVCVVKNKYMDDMVLLNFALSRILSCYMKISY